MLQRLTPTTDLEAGVEDASGFDLREALHFVWRQWVFIASIVALTLVVGVVYLVRQTPLYTASVQVLLDPRKERTASNDQILTDFSVDLQSIESQMAIIRSTSLMQRVVEKERQLLDAETGGPSGTSLLDAIRGLTPAAPADVRPQTNAVSQAIPPSIMAAIGVLQGGAAVSKGPGFVIIISYTSVDPGRAARIANAIADAYVVDKLDARYEAARRASSWLSDRITELRTQVRASEEAVTSFKAEHNLLQSAPNVSLNQQQLTELSGRLVAVRTELAEKKARLDLVKAAEAKGDSALALPDLFNAPSVMPLRAQEALIAQREADLLARYNDCHPLVVNVRAERRDIQRSINAEIQRLAANVQAEYDVAKARVGALEQSLRDVTGQTGADTSSLVMLRELERTAAVNKSLFDDFLQKAKLTQEQSTFEAREARIITPALPPGGPSYPQKTRFLGIALIVGLLLGVGGAIAKEQLNAGFTTPQQVEDVLKVPLLGSISRMEARDLTVAGKVIKIPLYPTVKPLSRYSESIRAIRSGLQMADVDNPPKVVMFTSTVPGEGKTTLALSFAASAAQTSLRVLFVDADLRRPSGSEFFGLKKEKGLVDLLLGQATAQEVVRYNEEAALWVLAAGSKTQNPPDLLGSDRMKSFIASFKQSFDVVVLDLPPVGPVIDPAIILQLADKVVYVVKWAGTAREMVRHAVQQLSGHKKVAGVVFNHVNEHMAQKYGKYAYSYYYGNRYYKNYYTE